MDTLTPATTCCHTRLQVRTRHPTEFIDLTDQVEAVVAESGLRIGVVNIQTLHTTTAVVVNEKEPLLHIDFLDVLEGLAPRERRYRHDDPFARTVNVTDGERVNGHAHCRALFLPSSACLNVSGGRLLLGRWQRVFFLELDGPQDREVSILGFGETWR